MPQDKDSEVLALLQPELLTPDQLITYIKSRCSEVQNLTALPKERLVRLFRQMILPLPQRRYRENRRGRFLTARRVKSGLERGEEDKSSKIGKRTTDSDRLKPVPDSCTPNKIRITSSSKSCRDEDLDKIVINDRRSSRDAGKCEGTTKRKGEEPSSSGRIILKRNSSNAEKSDRESNKKQRTAIKWP